MGGRISLNSEQGRGSVFTITLDAVAVAAGAPSGRVRELAHTLERDFGGQVVLVVDDIPTNRKILQAFLDMANLNVVEASNGAEALEKAHEINPALILMDKKMPIMNGDEAARRIKENLSPAPPIIAITASTLGSGEAVDEDERQRDVFDAFLRKPITRAALMECISGFLKSATRECVPCVATIQRKIALDVAAEDRETAVTLARPFLSECDALIRVKNVRRIKTFAENVEKAFPDERFAPVRVWARELARYSDEFDTEGITEHLREFHRFASMTN